jgi:Ca2+/Na+ antiporter
MGLALGVLLCVAPQSEWSPTRTAAWPFVLPAGVLALIAGFSGALNWLHALFLLFLGACVRGVWVSRSTTADPLPLAAVAHGKRANRPGGFPVQELSSAAEPGHLEPTSVAVPDDHSVASGATDSTDVRRRYWFAQLLLAVAIGGVGGWLGFKATMHADERTRVATSGLIALAVLSPLLILPMLGTGAIAAHHGKLGAAMATIVGVVLLNLCLLVPLVIMTHYVNQLTLSWPGGERTWEAIRDNLKPMPYPLAAWRIDTVLLIVLGLMLVPVSLGRWRLGRLEGLGLTFVYAAYLIVSTIITVRM